MGKKKVGIPRAFFYYIYYPAWRTYFEALGYEVVTSPETTKDIVDSGSHDALAEACVPVKIFFGHVKAIKDEVDYLFIPRIMSMNGKTIYCPKFLGLPDMIKATVADLPPIIDVTIDARESRLAVQKAAMAVAKDLGHSSLDGLKALRQAVHVHKRYVALQRAGAFPDEAIPVLFAGDKDAELNLLNSQKSRAKATIYKTSLKLAVVGYPYTVYDKFVNVNLLEKLGAMGVETVTMEMLDPALLNKQSYRLEKRIFWTFSDQASRAAYHYFEHVGEVDGIIHVTAFGCGPDFIVDKLMEIESKTMHGQVPFMSLSVDEHTGEGGVMTRVEAFCEMVRRRKEAAV